MNTGEVVSCLEEQGEISEEGTPGVDLERCGRTRMAESGHWNLHSPFLRLTVFKDIWFSWAQRGLMIHWGPGPQLLWREGEWKRDLAAEPKERTLPRQRGFTKEKGKGSGARPLLLGQHSQIYWLLVCHWDENQLSWKPSGGCSQHCLSEDVAYFTYKPHCNYALIHSLK